MYYIILMCIAIDECEVLMRTTNIILRWGRLILDLVLDLSFGLEY